MEDKDVIHVVNNIVGDVATTSCRTETTPDKTTAYFGLATCKKCRGEKN